MVASIEGEGESEGVPKKLLSSSRTAIFLDLARGGLSAFAVAASDDFCPGDVVGLEAGSSSCAGETVSIFSMSSNEGANLIFLCSVDELERIGNDTLFVYI